MRRNKEIFTFLHQEVYVPCVLIVVLSWVSFWIHREATSDRVGLGTCIQFVKRPFYHFFFVFIIFIIFRSNLFFAVKNILYLFLPFTSLENFIDPRHYVLVVLNRNPEDNS